MRARSGAVGRWILEREGRLFGALLGVIALDHWRTLIDRFDEYWIYLSNGIYDTPLLSLLVIVLSTFYMSVIALILWTSRKPIAQYHTLMPNLMAVLAGFGVYCFGLLEPALTRPAGLYLPLGLLALGAAIVLWALWFLRRAFSVVPQARRIETRGPYSYIRHPMYLGNIFTIAGLGLLVGTPLAMALALAISALQVVRSRYEDRLLVATFGDYGAYMTRVNGFIPRLAYKWLSRVALIGLVLALGAAEEASAQTKGAARADPKLAAQCGAWHQKALASQWFTEKEAVDFEQTNSDQESLAASTPACKEFFALHSRCEALEVDRISALYSMPERAKKPSTEYLKALSAFVKGVEDVPGCKAIIGFESVCAGLKDQARHRGKLTPKQQSMLRECADLSIGRGTAGLSRGGL